MVSNQLLLYVQYKLVLLSIGQDLQYLTAASYIVYYGTVIVSSCNLKTPHYLRL